MYVTASQTRRVGVLPSQSSLLATNCNRLLCSALNLREADNLEWFAMLHSDIEPEAYWIDKLIAEAEKHGADLMSAVVPVKNRTGRTSTAIAARDSRLSAYCILTQHQVRHPSFPDTFDLEQAAAALEGLPGEMRVADVPRSALLVNTGCMVYRLAQWRLGIKFEQLDDIVEFNGQYAERSLSEDWSFSRLVAEHGGKVMATRLLKLTHWGSVDWRAEEVWGEPRWL
jgi:hypothetical protein